MKKDKKFKVGILIIELVFILLYFPIWFGAINISINNETIENRNIRPILSNGKSSSFEWSCTWGGAGDDEGIGVAVDSSENVYVAGGTWSFGAGLNDMVLVKYDGNGVLLWNRTWGGANDDYGEGVAVDSVGNIYIAGHTRSFGAGIYDMVLVKYDGNGVQQWNRTWGGASWDEGFGVAIDSLGKVYLVGSTGSSGAGIGDMVLVKYDGDGVQQWNRTWGGASWDEGFGVAIDSSDDVFVAGYTDSFGAGITDMVLVKYDENGVQHWYRTWGGEANDYGYGVAVDSRDNVYLTGWTMIFGAGDYDMVLVKYSYTERPPSDGLMMILIIVVSIASVVGVGIAITYFIRKRRKIVE